MFPAAKEEGGGHERERKAITVAGEGIFRNTVATLLTMREIGRGIKLHLQLLLSASSHFARLWSHSIHTTPVLSHTYPLFDRMKKISKSLNHRRHAIALTLFRFFYFFVLFCFVFLGRGLSVNAWKIGILLNQVDEHGFIYISWFFSQVTYINKRAMVLEPTPYIILY